MRQYIMDTKHISSLKVLFHISPDIINVTYLRRYRCFNASFCRRPLRAVGSSLWITGWCCHKMAKGGKLEPWKWHVLVHLL